MLDETTGHSSLQRMSVTRICITTRASLFLENSFSRWIFKSIGTVKGEINKQKDCKVYIKFKKTLESLHTQIRATDDCSKQIKWPVSRVFIQLKTLNKICLLECLFYVRDLSIVLNNVLFKFLKCLFLIIYDTIVSSLRNNLLLKSLMRLKFCCIVLTTNYLIIIWQSLILNILLMKIIKIINIT